MFFKAIVFKLVHELKVELLIVVNPLCNETETNFSQLANAPSPMAVIVVGIVMLVKDVHPLNKPLGISCKPEGIVIPLSDEQL
jgi:hypothetical protein